MRRGPGVRVLMRRLHLWLGLGLGLLFALLGLTGSALVFYTGLDEALHPAIRTAGSAPGLTSTVWDRALATGRARFPKAGGKWTFEVTGEGGPIPARYYPAPARHGMREMVWFSPDGARILRVKPWGGYLMSWLYQLHMQLLVGDVGHQIVGWSGVAMLVLLATGLIAWWPRGRWRKALAFKRNAVAIRRLHDLHKLFGLWSIALLMILVATGVLLALPNVAQGLLAPTPVPAPRSAAGPRDITIARALSVAQAALPDGRVTFFDVPATGDAPLRMRLQVPGDPHGRFPGSYVFVDRHSGRVLAVHDIRRGNRGTAITAWVRTLHDGSVGGLATRVLAVLLGFVPAILFATGVLRWMRRRRVA